MKNYTSRLLLYGLILLSSCTSKNQDHPDADDLAVTWELVSNQIGDRPAHRSAFTIVNRGKVALGNHGWALYFNQATRTPVPGAVSGPVLVEQINGDFYRLRPTLDFLLEPGDSLTITFDAEEWIIKRSDAPDGLYIVFSDEDGTEEKATPISHFNLRPLTRPDQIDRFTDDGMPIPTPVQRYTENQLLEKLPPEALPTILPRPRSAVAGVGAFELSGEVPIQYERSLESEAQFLARTLGQVLNAPPPIIEGLTLDGIPAVRLSLDPRLSGNNSPEAYRLAIDADGATITGADAAGVFYGLQSLLALLPVEAWRQPAVRWSVPAGRIDDGPRFPYRGMHLDVARHFHGKATVLKMLDIMAFYKDPEEPGLYWGGFCNTRQAFEFMPFDLFKSMRRDDMGHFFADQDFAGMESLHPASRRNILGLQGHLWSETLKTPQMVEYYYLPKMIGLAERAWAAAAPWEMIEDRSARQASLDEDWKVFANAVGQREFPRLDYLFGGFNYRLAPPGARFIDGRLHANTDFPGPIIRYTTDGSEPTINSPEYTAPLDEANPVKLRIFDTRGRGSRTVTLERGQGG